MEFRQSSNLTIAGQRCHENVGVPRGTQLICFLLFFFHSSSYIAFFVSDRKDLS